MGNARTRDEIGFVKCPDCNGTGEKACCDEWCSECDGHGRVLKETPRLAVQRLEGGRWRTLLRVDGDQFEEAVQWQLQYLGEHPGNYRLVQEIDEDLGNGSELLCEERP